eukprot:362936-Chlamydomonas_euryale.AAC.4
MGHFMIQARKGHRCYYRSRGTIYSAAFLQATYTSACPGGRGGRPRGHGDAGACSNYLGISSAALEAEAAAAGAAAAGAAAAPARGAASAQRTVAAPGGRGRAADDSAEWRTTAGAPAGPLAAPGRHLHPRGHAAAVPVSSPEAASTVPSICASCVGCSTCRRPTGGEGPGCRPQGHVAAAAFGQPCSGAAMAPAPQRSGGH